MSGWWYHASQSERLAQIDGAIELGMTAKQCAINCGCWDAQNFARSDDRRVLDFALNHGRHFSVGPSHGKRRDSGNVTRYGCVISRRAARLDDAKDAFLAGEPVNMWEVE